MLYATDAVALADVRVSDDGYLEGWARTARTGCQTYLGSEIGRPDLRTVTIYRDDAAVFDRKSLESFAQIPVTVDHPPVAVTPKNWREHARGTTGTEVLRDGEFLKIGLKVTDAAAIADVQSGKRQLSVGYTTDLLWGDGIAPDGTAYQARQTNIVANHIAIVSAGRAGAQCRIGDSWPALNADGARPSAPDDHARSTLKGRKMDLQTVKIGDHAVQMTDAAAIAVAGLESQNATLIADNLTLKADIGKAQTAHAAAILAKDAELATARTAVETKDGELAVLRQQLADAQMTPAKLDAAVAARAAVIGAAKIVLGDSYKPEGKTEAQIRRDAVALRMGDAATAMSDAAIDGAFAALTASAPAADPVRNAFVAGLQTADAASPEAKAAAAQAKRLDDMRNAWKGKAA